MYERFTDRARKVMQLANQEAQRFFHEYIGTEYILLGLVQEGSGVAANVLKNLDIDLRKVRLEVERIVQSGPDMVTMGKLPQTPRAKKVIEYAVEESERFGHNYVGTEHLLLGLLREAEGVAAQVLLNLGMRLDDVRGEVLNLLGSPAQGDRPGASPTTRTQTPALDSFGRDLTALAARGQLEPIVGREAEVDRVLEALRCRTWNRVLLVSESAPTTLGVVEAVACRIVRQHALGVPRPRLVAVHPCSFLGGSASRARTRLLAVLGEARRASDVILFLDDMHLLGQCEPEEGLAGVVQASLLIGYRHPVLAAASPDGYRRFLEPNRGLATLFDTLILEPPTREQTAEQLRRQRHRFEAHHRVRIGDDALAAAVEAAATMPATRPLADWATLLLDRACARLRLRTTSLEPASLAEALAELTRQKEQAVVVQDFELAARLRDQAEQLKQGVIAGTPPGAVEPVLTPELLHEVAQTLGGSG